VAAFRGALRAARLDAGLATRLAVFLEFLVAARADAPFLAPLARFLAVRFAALVTAVLAALFTTLFDARFAPFAFFALFFDAFDLAIGEPLRPSTALRTPRLPPGAALALTG
jgi:hypothetical protein